MEKSSFTGIGGIRIATRQWRPDGAPRAAVVLIHGFNAHSGYMVWPAEQFAAAGYAVYALDLRGRGESEGERFYVEKFQDYLDDVNTLVEQAKTDLPGLQVFVLGHSAGGVVAANYAYDHKDEIAGLISENFAYDVGLPHLAALALEGAAKLAPHAHLLKLKNADFSRDPQHVEEMDNDPLIEKETQPLETLAELAKASDRLTAVADTFKVPILLLHGTADKAARYQGSERFYENIASADKTLKLYEGHYHDLLGDIGKEEVMKDILDWVEARTKQQ